MFAWQAELFLDTKLVFNVLQQNGIIKWKGTATQAYFFPKRVNHIVENSIENLVLQLKLPFDGLGIGYYLFEGFAHDSFHLRFAGVAEGFWQAAADRCTGVQIPPPAPVEVRKKHEQANELEENQ